MSYTEWCFFALYGRHWAWLRWSFSLILIWQDTVRYVKQCDMHILYMHLYVYIYYTNITSNGPPVPRFAQRFPKVLPWPQVVGPTGHSQDMQSITIPLPVWDSKIPEYKGYYIHLFLQVGSATMCNPSGCVSLCISDNEHSNIMPMWTHSGTTTQTCTW